PQLSDVVGAVAPRRHIAHEPANRTPTRLEDDPPALFTPLPQLPSLAHPARERIVAVGQPDALLGLAEHPEPCRGLWIARHHVQGHAGGAGCPRIALLARLDLPRADEQEPVLGRQEQYEVTVSSAAL